MVGLAGSGEPGAHAGARPSGGVSEAVGGLRRLDLVAVDDVPPGTIKLVEADEGGLVLVVNLGGTFHAVQGICSHQYSELDLGFLTGESITCALHLSRFDLLTGDALDPPAELPLAVYPVVVEDGRVLIEVPDGPLEVYRQ